MGSVLCDLGVAAVVVENDSVLLVEKVQAGIPDTGPSKGYVRW